MIPRRSKRFFCFFTNCHTGSGAHPAFFSIGTGVLSLSIEWLEHEVDHSP